MERGVALVTPRFTDNGDGTVTDNQTGLIWLKDANCFGTRTWADAISDCNGLASGSCGLTDSSSAGDWRLPNIKELLSLIDWGQHTPALPLGHPFDDVQSFDHFTSTTDAINDNIIWRVHMGDGDVLDDYTSPTAFVWPVRGGH